MKITSSLSIVVLSLFLVVCNASGQKSKKSNSGVTPLTGAQAVSEGSIIYALPRTVLTVFVGMERTIEKPGPYAQFAGDLLGLGNVIKAETETWSVESIRLKASGEVDPSEYYIIESTSQFLASVLSLKREGLILDLNPGQMNFGLSGLDGAEKDRSQLTITDMGSDEYFSLQTDTAYRRLTVDSTFVRIPYVVEKKKKLTTEQLAEKAAKKLMEMREGKHMILTGEANVFPQSDAAINEINRLEKEYTELFTGKTLKETRTYTYNIIPDKGMAGKPVTLFQFSETTGPHSKNGSDATQMKVELVPEQKTRELNLITRKQAEKDAPVFDKLYYRVPDVVNIKISLGDEILYSSRILIYQFGEIVQLPSNYVIGK
jgi:hypothetical protein